ncbi:hypothetical protein PG994_004765 [Apiospora phragmitis]|uniref:Uncharacterized protein n=1 Tax=Apiospora phragmitis TaxID=2905665 RepID=A0ABR1VU55_9PEZI
MVATGRSTFAVAGGGSSSNTLGQLLGGDDGNILLDKEVVRGHPAERGVVSAADVFQSPRTKTRPRESPPTGPLRRSGSIQCQQQPEEPS